MRILVTGSSGQIGTNLALQLLHEGHQVIGVDRRPNPWTEQIDTLIDDLRVTQPTSTGGLGRMPSKQPIDVVVHLAAYAKVHELVEYPERALENVTMTFTMLEYCRHNRIPIILGSTREVYGNIQRDVTTESDADFMIAESPYAASKIAGESLVYAYARCYGLPFLVFRFSNVYGRYDTDLERMERVIPLFMHKIRHQEPITIYGQEKVLDFTYVDDCVAGITAGIEMLVSGQDKNYTLNLAYGQGHTLAALATYIGEALGTPPRMTFASARAGEVTHYVANIDRAHAVLHYTPRVPLAEGIKRAVAWSTEWGQQHQHKGVIGEDKGSSSSG